MAALSSRIRYTIEAVNLTREEFQEVENGIERLRKARLRASRVVLEEQRAQRFLSQAYRAQHQQFMDTISVMRSVGYIGRSLVTMWQAYTIGQIRVSEGLKSVKEAQIEVNTALALYGENSVYYLDAVSNLEDLEAAAKKAKGDQTMGLIGLGMSAIGVAAQVGTLAVKLGKISELALAGGIVLPIVVAWGMKELFGEPETDPELPPGPGNRGGFNIPEWLGGLIPPGGGTEGRNMGGPAGRNITITQINYGLEGAQDSINALEDLLNNLLINEP